MILKFCLTDFSTSLELEITKKPITISLVSNSQQYTVDTITPQINSFQLVSEDDVQVSLEPNAPLVEIGDYTLTLVVSGQDADNYQFTLANNQFTITKATPIENDVYENITFESNDEGLKTIISIAPNADGYENATQILNTLSQLNLLKNSVGDNIAYSVVEQNVNYTQGGRLKAGSATYLATLAQAPNYTFETFIIEINVAKIDVVVSFDNEFTFNGNEIILSPQYSILDGDDVIISLHAEGNQTIINAGQYGIELSVSGEDADCYGNYQGQTSYTFTVNDPSPAGLDTTILIIIIVCAVVVLLLIILTIILVVRHKKKKKQQTIANANN